MSWLMRRWVSKDHVLDSNNTGSSRNFVLDELVYLYNYKHIHCKYNVLDELVYLYIYIYSKKFWLNTQRKRGGFKPMISA